MLPSIWHILPYFFVNVKSTQAGVFSNVTFPVWQKVFAVVVKAKVLYTNLRITLWGAKIFALLTGDISASMTRGTDASGCFRGIGILLSSSCFRTGG